MPRLPQAKPGDVVNYPPTGFPLFFDKRKPRIVTADPWSFFEHVIADRKDKKRESAALSFIDQAFDFYEAARNPQIGSKPLLYYYSFLNLVKTALLIRRVNFPAASHHGINYPRANERTRLRLGGQKVRIEKVATNHSQLFPEFLKILGGDANQPKDIRVLDLFAQIPSIHRTFTRVSKRRQLFLPVERFDLLRNRNEVWARVVIKKKDKDVEATSPGIRGRQIFRQCLHQIESKNSNEVWFETSPVVAQRRGVDRAIKELAGHLCRLGISSILVSTGYRYYFCDLDLRRRLPPLAAALAAFFYLGSVTRYKPDVFEKILSGGYSWIVWELIATQPVQFLYTLASELAGVDVVRPFAAN